MIEKGRRVRTPMGIGEVIYRRMAPPDYSRPECYSVLLDCERRPGYSGTIFPADKVEELEDPLAPQR